MWKLTYRIVATYCVLNFTIGYRTQVVEFADSTVSCFSLCLIHFCAARQVSFPQPNLTVVVANSQTRD